MIKALEVSSRYKTLGAPKGANWISDVYVVQRQCLRVTSCRPNAQFSKIQGTLEPRLEPEAFEIDLEFAPEPLALLEF